MGCGETSEANNPHFGRLLTSQNETHLGGLRGLRGIRCRFIMWVESTQPDSDTVRRAKLHLVDLATALGGEAVEDEILAPRIETMVETIRFVGIFRGIVSFQGFVGGAKWTSSTHNRGMFSFEGIISGVISKKGRMRNTTNLEVWFAGQP